MGSTQKLAIWIVSFLLVATVGSYFVMKLVQESMDQKRYKGIDSTLSSLDKLNQMQEFGAYDFNFKILNAFNKIGLTAKDQEQQAEETEVLLSKYKGKVILLNFWASWCEPCIKEFPDLITLVTKVPDVVIIAVSRDNRQEEAESFIRAFPESKGKIIFSWDPSGDITRAYGTEVLPESFIIKKDFKVDKKISGIEAWASDNIVDYFKYLTELPAN